MHVINQVTLKGTTRKACVLGIVAAVLLFGFFGARRLAEGMRWAGAAGQVALDQATDPLHGTAVERQHIENTISEARKQIQASRVKLIDVENRIGRERARVDQLRTAQAGRLELVRAVRTALASVSQDAPVITHLGDEYSRNELEDEAMRALEEMDLAETALATHTQTLAGLEASATGLDDGIAALEVELRRAEGRYEQLVVRGQAARIQEDIIGLGPDALAKSDTAINRLGGLIGDLETHVEGIENGVRAHREAAGPTLLSGHSRPGRFEQRLELRRRLDAIGGGDMPVTEGGAAPADESVAVPPPSAPEQGPAS